MSQMENPQYSIGNTFWKGDVGVPECRFFPESRNMPMLKSVYIFDIDKDLYIYIHTHFAYWILFRMVLFVVKGFLRDLRIEGRVDCASTHTMLTSADGSPKLGNFSLSLFHVFLDWWNIFINPCRVHVLSPRNQYFLSHRPSWTDFSSESWQRPPGGKC